MSQEEKIYLPQLNIEQAQKAMLAIDEIETRARAFVKGLNNEETYREIIEDAFEALSDIVQARYENPQSPTNMEAIQKILKIQDSLDASDKKGPPNNVAYETLFDFIKSGRIVAFMLGQDITNESPKSLRDLAMNQADIPREH